MPRSLFTVGVLWGLAACMLVAGQIPVCQRSGEYLQNRAACSSFWHCDGTTPVQKNCAAGLVFSKTVSVCVWPNTELDDCTGTQGNPARVVAPTIRVARMEGFTLAGRESITTGDQNLLSVPCTGISGSKSHSASCHLFFNCSLHRSHPEPFLGLYMEECPYTMLFSEVTNTCHPADIVECGTRMLTKNPCDYYANMCSGSHCRECSSLMADCTDQPDGPNVWPGRPNSPQFIVCYRGWFLGDDYCRPNSQGQSRVFSPETKVCVVDDSK